MMCFKDTMIFFKLTYWYIINDIYINHNNCLLHTYYKMYLQGEL